MRWTPTIERDIVTGRIVDIEVGMGQALLANPPISSEQLAAAQAHFSDVLKLAPRHPQASEELRLAKAYVDGKAAAARGAWDRALRLLQPAYDVRPQYLGGALLPPMYDAYIGLGDQQPGRAKTARWPTRCIARRPNCRWPTARWPRRAWRSRRRA